MKKLITKYKTILLISTMLIVAIIMLLTMFFAKGNEIEFIAEGKDYYCYNIEDLSEVNDPAERYNNVFEVINTTAIMNNRVYLTSEIYSGSNPEPEYVELHLNDNIYYIYLDNKVNENTDAQNVRVEVYLMSNVIDDRINDVNKNKIELISHKDGLEIFFDRSFITVNEFSQSQKKWLRVNYYIRITNA